MENTTLILYYRTYFPYMTGNDMIYAHIYIDYLDTYISQKIGINY